MKSVRKYYKLLKLSKDATPEQVKTAYRKLARDWHPDHNTRRMKWRKRKAERKIREINTAKEIILVHAAEELEKKRLASAIAAAERWAKAEAERGARIAKSTPDESRHEPSRAEGRKREDAPSRPGVKVRAGTGRSKKKDASPAPGASFHAKTSARASRKNPSEPNGVDFQTIDPAAAYKKENADAMAAAPVEDDIAPRFGPVFRVGRNSGHPSPEAGEARKKASAASSWWSLGKYKQALEAYGEAVRLDPGFAAAFNNRGLIHMEIGQYYEAITDFTRALSLAPGMVNVYVNRAGAYRDIGKYKRALADYDLAIQLNPDLAEAYRHRGIIRHKLGFRSRAGKDLHQALLLADAAVYGRDGAGVSAYFRNSFT